MSTFEKRVTRRECLALSIKMVTATVAVATLPRRREALAMPAESISSGYGYGPYGEGNYGSPVVGAANTHPDPQISEKLRRNVFVPLISSP